MSELSEDLIARLRIGFDVELTESVLFEAADRIEELEARVRQLEKSDINVGFEPLLRVCSVSGNPDGIGLPTSIIIERVDDSEMFAVYVPSN